MDIWQLQDAKAKFSEMVRRATNAPQIVTVHGREEIVVISKKQYDKLTNKKQSLVSFLQNSPFKDIANLKNDDLDFKRDKSLPRAVVL